MWRYVVMNDDSFNILLQDRKVLAILTAFIFLFDWKVPSILCFLVFHYVGSKISSSGQRTAIGCISTWRIKSNYESQSATCSFCFRKIPCRAWFWPVTQFHCGKTNIFRSLRKEILSFYIWGSLCRLWYCFWKVSFSIFEAQDSF